MDNTAEFRQTPQTEVDKQDIGKLPVFAEQLGNDTHLPLLTEKLQLAIIDHGDKMRQPLPFYDRMKLPQVADLMLVAGSVKSLQEGGRLKLRNNVCADLNAKDALPTIVFASEGYPTVIAFEKDETKRATISESALQFAAENPEINQHGLRSGTDPLSKETTPILRETGVWFYTDTGDREELKKYQDLFADVAPDGAVMAVLAPMHTTSSVSEALARAYPDVQVVKAAGAEAKSLLSDKAAAASGAMATPSLNASWYLLYKHKSTPPAGSGELRPGDSLQ